MSKSLKSNPKTLPSTSTPLRKIAGINPLKQQFEPTKANPIPQHKRMAGA